ncbi:MAG: succinate--CoA ligase subunit alpha [Desulfovibrionales bacterium]
MKLNEHQSKRLFSEVGIPLPPGQLIRPEKLGTTLPSFPLPWMLKAQTLSGGRGKQGGIRTVQSKDEFIPAAEELFCLELSGQRVPCLRVEPKMAIQREFYISLALVRSRKCFVLTVGNTGGVDIEAADPETLLIQTVHPLRSHEEYQIRAAFFHLGVDKSLWGEFRKIVHSLFLAVERYGLLLAEINPLVLTPDQQWMALDAKVDIDDNVVALNEEFDRFYMSEYVTPQEERARQHGLSFHKLDGWVGLVANGAGLAMATMDQLNFAGLKAANFLDLGGAADETRISLALNLLFTDSSVHAVLVNIFGGILSCEKVARGLTRLLQAGPPPKPIVLRLSGHGANEGYAIIKELNLPDVYVASDLQEALAILGEMAPSNMVTDLPAPEKKAGFPRLHQRISHLDTLRPVLGLSSRTQVLVQGITGKEGQFHSTLMQAMGTRIAAGVTPFKGGTQIQSVPVYDSVHQACQRHEIGASVIFVPAPFAPDAILEAAAEQIPWIVCITEGIPQRDMLRVVEQLKGGRSRLLGPNTPGLIVPGQIKLGIMPGEIFQPGPVAVLSRSGTLTYEAVDRLSSAGIGQSFCAGIGGDPFVGSSFAELCDLLREDAQTEAVLVLGEIGGSAEEELAMSILDSNFPKPVFAFVAGQTAPPGKRLGHAGAILEGGEQDLQTKLETLRVAGCTLCPDLDSIPRRIGAVL